LEEIGRAEKWIDVCKTELWGSRLFQGGPATRLARYL